MPENPALLFRTDVQGLRAVAILLVVLAHAGLPVLSGGFVGVDVFFVLSGYLITGLLVAEYRQRGRVRMLAFVARRLKRLLPALLVMLTVVILMASVLLSSHEFSEQTASVAYAATWTSNLYFTFTTFDYFAELRLRDLFLHTWSLGVEEQFYLLWSALAILLLIPVRRRVSPKSRRRLLTVALGLIFASSLGLSLYWSSFSPMWAFYLMPSRIWQFALGAAVFFLYGLNGWTTIKGPPQARGQWRIALGLPGILLILGSAILLDSDLVYPDVWAIFPSIGAALVIAGGSQGTRHFTSSLLSHPALVWLGDRSYSFYLWHWPVLMFGFAWGLKGDPSATTALVLLSLLFATVSYRLVELPFWKGRFSRHSPIRGVAVSVLSIALVAIGLNQTAVFFRDSAVRGAQLVKAARSDVPVIYKVGCDTWFLDATVDPCIFGGSEQKKTAVLIGDSIGAQWYSVLPAIFDAAKWRLVVLTKSACAMVDQDYHYKAAGGLYKVCTEWRNQALADLAAISPDVVFVGSAATYGFTQEQWTGGTNRVLQRLSGVADQIVIIAGTPQLSFDGPGCLERWLARHEYGAAPEKSVCREPVGSGQALRVAEYLKQVAVPFDNAGVLDLNDLVCPDGYCAARSPDGLVVFRDQQHLTDSFVRAQAKIVKQRLHRLGVGGLLLE